MKGKKSKLTTCIFFILAVFILVSWLLTVADLISPTLKQSIKLTTVSRLLNVNQPKNSKLATVSRQLNALHSKNVNMTTVSNHLILLTYIWLVCALQNSEKRVKYLNSIWINKSIFWDLVLCMNIHILQIFK